MDGLSIQVQCRSACRAFRLPPAARRCRRDAACNAPWARGAHRIECQGRPQVAGGGSRAAGESRSRSKDHAHTLGCLASPPPSHCMPAGTEARQGWLARASGATDLRVFMSWARLSPPAQRLENSGCYADRVMCVLSVASVASRLLEAALSRPLALGALVSLKCLTFESVRRSQFGGIAAGAALGGRPPPLPAPAPAAGRAAHRPASCRSVQPAWPLPRLLVCPPQCAERPRWQEQRRGDRGHTLCGPPPAGQCGSRRGGAMLHFELVALTILP